MARTKKQTPMTPCASALVLGQTTFGLFRGCWSFDCSGTGMMRGGSECGLPSSSLRTVGGLQDTDGDGLADIDEVESDEQERITHSFTVYSLRLQPDLNADNRIDVEDVKLVKGMKLLGLGWCVSPGKVSPLKLNVDVKIPGDVYMIVKKTGGKGKIRVYSSEPYHEMDDQTLQFAEKGMVTEVSESQFAIHELSEGGHPDSASQILWLEVSEPGTSGSIEVVYEGTDQLGYYRHTETFGKLCIDPVVDEWARWCIFSFVTPTRSLAFGQLDMNGIVDESINLEGKGYSNDHYGHSKQFRSNVADMYEIWSLIKNEVTTRKDVVQKSVESSDTAENN